MQANIADFMIHISDPLSEGAMATLADSIRDNVCVTSACVSANDPHLIMVNYDPECSSAHAIVKGIAGVRARAVGM